MSGGAWRACIEVGGCWTMIGKRRGLRQGGREDCVRLFFCDLALELRWIIFPSYLRRNATIYLRSRVSMRMLVCRIRSCCRLNLRVYIWQVTVLLRQIVADRVHGPDKIYPRRRVFDPFHSFLCTWILNVRSVRILTMVSRRKCG